jgi:hypothetical protein
MLIPKFLKHEAFLTVDVSALVLWPCFLKGNAVWIWLQESAEEALGVGVF